MSRIAAVGLFLTLALAGTLLCPSVLKADGEDGEDGEDGKALFLKYDCQSCHEVASQQIVLARELEAEDGTPPDLSTVGDEITDAAWMEKWLKKRVKKDGTKHKKRFRGSKTELKLLVDWMLTLKAE